MEQEDDKASLAKEDIQRVLRAYLVFRSEELIIPLNSVEPTSDCQSKFLKNFTHGLRSVVCAATLPFELISASVYEQKITALAIAERIRALGNEDIDPTKDPEMVIQERASQKFSAYMQSKDGFKDFQRRLVDRLNDHLAADNVAQGAEEVLNQSLISTWSLFESSVRDFIIDFVDETPNVADAIMTKEELRAFFGKQPIDVETLSNYGFDLRTSMGKILFSNRKLDNLSNIRSVLEAIFCDEKIRTSLGSEMWLLNQRRHLFVHRRGIIDSEYLSRTEETLPLGQRLRLTSSDVENSFTAVRKAATAIATACFP